MFLLYNINVISKERGFIMGRTNNLKMKDFVSSKKMEAKQLRIIESSILSNEDYRVFRIVQLEESLGHFGVFPDGRFQHVMLSSCKNELEFVDFIKDYIRNELKITPVCISKTF